ncbi:hypothetical protein [Streptomyces sp. NPDC058985]|uniref:hypothetical protein n=1 Tax=Streptomyces sp. NPDC058985 TaxID=3346684 RepID=UPI0036A932C4
MAALADASDPGVLALLPSLVVAGAFAWSVARKDGPGMIAAPAWALFVGVTYAVEVTRGRNDHR